MIDPSGNKTGFSASESPDLFNVPGSYYYRDTITDADTGDNPTEVTHYLGIAAPQSGTYLLVLSGLSQGTFSLDIKAYTADGGRLQPVTLSGNVAPGSSITYEIVYSSVPGNNPTVSSIPGDINGDGIVNCSDLDIVKASFGKKVGMVGFDARADVNLDGVVDIRDLAFVAQHLPAGTRCQ